MGNFFSTVFAVFVICCVFWAIGQDLDSAREIRSDVDQFLFGKRTFEQRTIVQGLLTGNLVMQKTITFRKCVSAGRTYTLFRVHKTQYVAFSKNAEIQFRVDPLRVPPGKFMQLASRCRGSSCQMMSNGMLEIKPNVSACMTIVRGSVNPYHTFL